MRTAALAHLACPRCGRALVADTEKPAADGHVLAGELGCACGARYPIKRGVPRLFAGAVPADGGAFDPRPPRAEPWFLDRIAPLGPADFVDRTVLEAGCGAGHRAALAAGYGARTVVAVGTGPLTDDAFRHTRHLRRVHVVEGDLARLPVGGGFDLALALGSLERLESPEEGFRSLRASVMVGGRIAVWIRGRHDHAGARLEELREAVVTRVSGPLLRWLSLGPSAALALLLPLYRLRPLAHRLPLGHFLHELSRFPLAELHPLLIDRLTARWFHPVDRQQLSAWLAAPGLADGQVLRHDEVSFRAAARITAGSVLAAGSA